MRGNIGPRVVNRIRKPATKYFGGEGEKKGEFRDHVILEILLIFKKYLVMVSIVRTTYTIQGLESLLGIGISNHHTLHRRTCMLQQIQDHPWRIYGPKTYL